MSFPDVILYTAMKADILVDMGRANESLDIYKKVMRDKDSLYRNLSHTQMEQIQSLYDMDKLLLQREQWRAKIHIIFLAVIGTALLALITFVVNILAQLKHFLFHCHAQE